MKNNKGITLIALVITIIVLLILAGVTIAAITGNESAPNKAVEARQKNEEGAARDAATLLVAGKIQSYYEEKYVDRTSNAGTILTYLEEELSASKNVTTDGYKIVVAGGKITVTKTGETVAFVQGTVSADGVINWGGSTAQVIEVPAAGSTFVALSEDDNVKVKDANNKEIIVPVGFRISPNSGTTIEQGIVIEDENHNEFVWVPVGTEVTYSSTYNNSTLKTALGETATSGTITLGRYDFGTSSSRKQDIKSGTDVINDYYTESDEAFECTTKIYNWDTDEYDDAIATAQPSVAKNITDFINKTNAAGGYYIGRYEMGIEGATLTATDFYIGTWSENSQGSKKVVCQSGKTVYNYISRDEALAVAQGMYTSTQTKGKFECDLVNSYAWDTAIVFIEKCGQNSDYAFQTDGEGNLPSATGTKTDEHCKINDLSGNVMEWTTEYSSELDEFDEFFRKTYRGDSFYHGMYYTSCRHSGETPGIRNYVGFRPLLYVSSAEN